MNARTVALLSVLAASPAFASSDVAWEAGNRAAARACGIASKLRDPHASAPVLFPDTSAKTVMLVTGLQQSHYAKGAEGTVLCLYDRRTKKAEIADADGWSDGK